MPQFVPGLTLNQKFYASVVEPILAEHFPTLTYSAALIGYGSDVLGFDTVRSTDHEWGPRLLLFLGEQDFGSAAAAIDKVLTAALPPRFLGYSTAYSSPDHQGVRVRVDAVPGHIAHHIDFWTVSGFFLRQLAWDGRAPLGVWDWLSFPSQKLLEATSGTVFHDGLGTLGPVREQLHYYPDDVWRYMLSAQWMRIGQEESFLGRCHELGDTIGERLIGARLVRDLMGLCFGIERRYAPYSKWFGTAFERLAVSAELGSLLERALSDLSWDGRQEALHHAYAIVVDRFNALNLMAPFPARVTRFHDRPYQVIHADRIAEAVWSSVIPGPNGPIFERLGFVGTVDQLSDNTDFRENSAKASAYRALF